MTTENLDPTNSLELEGSPDPMDDATSGQHEPTEKSQQSADHDALSGPIEALLLMAESALSSEELAASLAAPVADIERALDGLRQFYDDTGRGFELRRVGAGWRLWTRAEHAEVLSAAILAGQTARLSQPALETLAVVAYLQPVTRARVAAVRGVNVDGVLRTLVARGLVAEADKGQAAETDKGRTNEAEAGHATRFATTDYFLERMGMAALTELPPLAPYLPEAEDLEAELGRLIAPDSAAESLSGQDSAVEENPGGEPGAEEHSAADENSANDEARVRDEQFERGIGHDSATSKEGGSGDD